MVTSVFVHGFRNDVHATLEAQGGGNYVVATCCLSAVLIRQGGAIRREARWHVALVLYGPRWTEKDIERAERNSRYLSASATAVDAVAVRDELLRGCAQWLSIPLKPVEGGREMRA